MKKHYTPRRVVDSILSFIPEDVVTLLEPSVGKGDFLLPVLESRPRISRVTCVDVDTEALNALNKSSQLDIIDSLSLINEDYLLWSARSDLQNHFDCVIMNPPFSGKSIRLLPLSISIGDRCDMNIHAPIEALFLLAAINQLRENGTLVAVVPSTVVASQKLRWLREILLKSVSLESVIELPHSVFKNVEAKTFLLIAKKGAFQRNYVSICYNNFESYEEYKIYLDDLSEELRFDFAYYKASRWLNSIRTISSYVAWSTIAEQALVLRGNVEDKRLWKQCIHTDCFINGRWRVNAERQLLSISDRGVKKGDILVKRVSKRCSLTFGLHIGLDDKACSSCIFILRSKNIEPILLLLGIRCVYATDLASSLLQRGTGAQYITKQSLSTALIPINLEIAFKQTVVKYKNAVKSDDFNSMVQIEDFLRRELELQPN